MTQKLEADVALLHIAAGEARMSIPPGAIALAPPRRTARGRSEDLFFGALSIDSTDPVIAAHSTQLIQSASEVYYGTPGSITAALRETAESINDQILYLNQEQGSEKLSSASLILSILRNNHLYVAQAGPAQATLIRSGQVNRMLSEEVAAHPLGIAVETHLRFFHLEALPHDLLLLTPSNQKYWSGPTLSGLANLDLTRSVDRLIAASSADLTGIAIRMVPAGEAVTSPEQAEPTKLPSSGRSGSHPRQRKSRYSSRLAGGIPSALKQAWQYSSNGFLKAGTFILRGIGDLLYRMAPGLSTPSKEEIIPPALMAGTALAVPVLVAIIASVIYFHQGRNEQFLNYLGQAQTSVQLAQIAETPQQTLQLWHEAEDYLTQALDYSSSSTATELGSFIQSEIDHLELIYRFDFQEVIPGGFQTGTRLSRLAASITDVYALDSTQESIYHAWTTGREYQLDSDFDCLEKGNQSGWTTTLDLAIQPAPGALDSEGLVLVDQAGHILYCAPGREPLAANLVPPAIGWGRISAMDMQYGKMYILDSEKNQIWIYSENAGTFSESPALFFVEDVPDLKDALDIVAAQDELLILYKDGTLDSCQRFAENVDGNLQFRVECTIDVAFQDERNGYPPVTSIPDATPVSFKYTPPPEPSLFFLDSQNDRVYHFSMRLVYHGQYAPLIPWESPISAIALGPLNDLFVASGNKLYIAPLLQ